jgi:hypothetical protein
MSALDDFIYQGTLPFVGRASELERLVAFWRATPQAQRLRASLVLAEAGIGKSRLLEEVIRAITAAGGTVVHCKLYPESSVSLAPLLARALWQSNVGRDLLRSEPAGTLPSVITAMRRLGRLRPTLLVVEDAHLLVGEAIGEFQSLLAALADETLALLTLCRPLEWKGRSILEPYLSERIELEGLTEGAIAELWGALFGEQSAEGIVGQLYRVTLGNGLAVRSSLRMALDSGFIVHEAERGAWHVASAEEGFIRMLERSVGMISEGMVMHLSEEEREAAGHLASLGEVFSREAAEVMIDDAARMISTLIDKGILSTSTVTAHPLAATFRDDPHHIRTSHYPVTSYPLLAFTHSLLHKYFADNAPAPHERLLHVIAGDLPLYSLLPIQRLKSADALTLPIDRLEPGARRILTIARTIDATSEWPAASGIFEITRALIAPRVQETEDERYWRARLCDAAQWFERRTSGNDLRRQVMLEHLELTVEPRTRGQAIERLIALTEKVEFGGRPQAAGLPDVWEELDRLFERFPDLHVSLWNISCLSAMLIVARQVRDSAMLARIQERVEEILRIETLTPEFRTFVKLRIYPEYILIFETAEELENRHTLLASLDALPKNDETTYEGRAIDFLMHTGQFDRMLKLIAQMIPRVREQGHLVLGFIYQLNRLVGFGGFGMSLEKIAETVYRSLEEITPARRGNMPKHAGEWMVCLGLLRGEPAWGEEMITRLIPDENDRASVFRMLLDMEKNDFARALDDLRADTSPNIVIDDVARTMLEPVLARIAGEPVADGTLVESVRAGIVAPQLRIWNVMVFHALILALEELAGDPRNAHIISELRPTLVDGLRMRLEWLGSRSLFAFMMPLLERHGDYLPAKERATWLQRIEQITAERTSAPSRRDRVRVGMLGTIEIAHADAEPEQLRGVRIRTLLGLLVADQMIGRSLSPREFVQIAGGTEEENPELARKKRNMAVVRLREAMGAEAILTDEKTPRLNLDRVDVDLLRADDLIKRAIAAGREGALVRAQPLLIEALELTRGEVPFPTLYETFFEAAREDFEFRLRSAIIDIAQGLLNEGDAGAAEEILRRGFEAMPDDEEVAELLQQALRAHGNRMEAERIRLRMREGEWVRG